MRIAFCVYGITPHVLERTEFYWRDFNILKSLGHEVEFVPSPLRLRRSFDLAFVWWWNYLWMWGPVARALGIPIVTTGVFDLGAFEHLSFPKRALKKWGTAYSLKNIFVSEQERREVPRAIRFGAGSLEYSPLAIDCAEYSRRTSTGDPSSPLTILNIAWQRSHNIRRKMVPELLTAFATFVREGAQARLILAGPPEDGGALLQSMARDLGVHGQVEFPGEVSRQEKIRLLQSCDLYCQVSRYEGFGVAIAEAMACGAPVLVSRVGAIPEVVGDCGSYVAQPSTEGILAGLRAWIQNPSSCAELGRRGADRIRDLFGIDRRRGDFKRILEQVPTPVPDLKRRTN